MRQLHKLAVLRGRVLTALAELRDISVECRSLSVHYASENNELLNLASERLRDASEVLQSVTTDPINAVTRSLQEADTCVGNYMKARAFFDVIDGDDGVRAVKVVSRLYERD